jgi:hypothetical protein
LLVFGAMLAIISGLIALVPKARSFVATKLKELWRYFVFNGIIQTILISFMSTCIIGIGDFLEKVLLGDEEIRSEAIVKFWLISFGAIFIIIWSYHILLINRKKLNNLEMEESYGKMYIDIDIRSRKGVFYFPHLLMRYLIFVIISSFYICPVF